MVFQRGRFAGVEVRGWSAHCRKCGYSLEKLTAPRCPKCGTAFVALLDPQGKRELELRVVPMPNSHAWRPAVFCDGQELPELTGTAPPRVVRPPKALSVTFGLTYLLMFLAVVVLPSTVRILHALHRDQAGSYAATPDILPWVVPFVVAAVSMLCVLDMRKWGVVAFGGLIALQLVLLVVTSVPISVVAVVIQALLWLLGVAYWGQME